MPAPDKNRLAGHDLVVTGATGYIGRHLVQHVAREGRRIHILGRPSLSQGEAKGVCESAHALGRISVIEHDGTVSSMAQGLRALSDPVIIHLAGLFISNHNESHIESLVEANLSFSCHLFEAMKQAGCRTIVNVGTAWEHGENGLYEPVNLYASMKHAAQRILDYYAEAERFRAITLKLLDTYGCNDTRRKLLPLLLQHAASGVPIDMSSGFQKINLTYIEDVVDALLHAAATALEMPEHGHDFYLLLSDENPSVRELVTLIRKISGTDLLINWGVHPSHPRQQAAPWIEGPRLPNWKPSVSLAEGIKNYFGVVNHV